MLKCDIINIDYNIKNGSGVSVLLNFINCGTPRRERLPETNGRSCLSSIESGLNSIRASIFGAPQPQLQPDPEHEASPLLSSSEELSPRTKFCMGLDRWCNEAPLGERDARIQAIAKMKSCYDLEDSTLDLRLLWISSLPSEIGQLTNLKSLRLGGNQIQSIPPEIGQLTNLESLKLDRNQIQSIPSEIWQLTNLKSLKLDRNQIQSISSEIGQLTNLESLSLSDNQIQSIPSEIWQLTNLKSLDLSNNRIQSIPSEIGQLTNLESLQLNNNQIQSIPSEIGQLTNLESLWLYGNQIQSIPSEIGQLTQLRDLFLSENQLQTISPEIWQLTNLKSLDLSNNRIQSIPSEIGQLTNLESLGLSNNQIQSIPSEIGQLTNLRVMLLALNPLQNLPQEILQLHNLQVLMISNSIALSQPQLVASLRIAGVRVMRSEDQRVPSYGHSSKYTLDLQKIENDPLAVLRDLQEFLRQNHSFPKIVYQGSEGIDAGGLSRDLVTRLFREIFQKENPYLPVLEWEENLLPVVHADFDSAKENYQTQLLYKAVGMIFAAAIQKGIRPIVTGEHFHVLLFELLYCLSLEDIRALPARFTSLDDFPAGESLLRKMLLSHLTSKIDGSEEQKREIAEELVGTFLENRFPDSFSIYATKEEFLEAYPHVGKIVQAAPGVLAIAQGMLHVLQNWELNADSAGKLQLNIQGYFSRDAVLKSLTWNDAGGDPEQNEQTKEFFKQWLEDETTSLEMISDFLFAVTGSSTLRDGQNLLVSFYTAEGPEEGMEWFPKFHACSSNIEMPRNYSDYATFKKMLEAGIRSAKYGFQAR